MPTSPPTLTLPRKAMKRRAFLAAAGAGLLAVPGLARAQQARLRRVAVTASGVRLDQMREDGDPEISALLRELRRLGHVEGRSVLIERWTTAGLANTEFDRLARSVVDTGPDAILANGSGLAQAFKVATAAI